MDIEKNSLIRPLVFGEVLFDEFEDKHSNLGGAPFNVAWHLQGFDLAPIFISRVGNDERGKIITDKMDKWGMDVSGIQFDPVYPTGLVKIALRNGQPTFDICPDQAYDFIEYSSFLKSLDSAPSTFIYHGSLALRSETNKRTLHSLLTSLNLNVFVDINLRPPWWNLPDIKRVLHQADYVKLSCEELEQITGREMFTEGQLRDQAQQVCLEYDLDLVSVTLGKKGSFVVQRSGEYSRCAVADVASLADTVGAGDAFASVLILGILKKWHIPDTIKRASEFAGRICSIRGAVLSDKSAYSDLLKKWEK